MFRFQTFTALFFSFDHSNFEENEESINEQEDYDEIYEDENEDSKFVQVYPMPGTATVISFYKTGLGHVWLRLIHEQRDADWQILFFKGWVHLKKYVQYTHFY